MNVKKMLETLNTAKKNILILSGILSLFFFGVLIYLVLCNIGDSFYRALAIPLALFFFISGAVIVYILYPWLPKKYLAADITKVILLSETNAFHKEYPLSKLKSALIGVGRDTYVDLMDTGRHYPDSEYAVLNRVENVWFAERLSESGSVGLKRAGGRYVYKLKTGICYRLYAHDTLHIAGKRLLFL